MLLQTSPLPFGPREALVGQISLVTVGGDEGFSYRSLVGAAGAKPKALTTPFGSTTNAALNP